MAVMALAGCNERRDTPPEAYAHLGDRLRARLHAHDFGFLGPCAYRLSESVIGHIPAQECYRFAPPQRFSGVWVNEYEGSRFCSGAKVDCPYGTSQTWLEWNGPLPAIFERDPERPDAYGLEFIGRRTLVAGAYGHMGGSRHYVLVDRLIRVEPVAAEKKAGPGSRPG
ncbi:hypothetical protein [Sphingomonas mesophila]|uniref:hypothetical protein n=1 Tax=Sphingomonas mesophila TaxID=2303576 RepID=UPI0013C2C150|nr:hypothetical protein [Sphingomonas mesophila]